MSSCEGCPGYHGHAWPITCPRSRGRLTERRVPTPSQAPFPLPPSLWSLCPGIFSTLCHWRRACPLPPLLPSSVSSLCPPCCGSQSRSLDLFASLSVPCVGEPALSCVVVGQTAQVHCSPPPSSLSTSGQLLIRVAARVRPTGSSAHRRCGALASHLHRPCIAASFASVDHMPPAVLICTCVLPLLVPLPQHWNHPMAHVASPTLAVVPPPHPGGPATSTRVCPQCMGGCRCRGLRGLAPQQQKMAGCTNQRRIHAARHRAITSAAVRWPLSLSTIWVPFNNSFFSAQAPPLLPPLLPHPLLPPFSCLPARSLASLVAHAPACRRPRHSQSP